MYKPNPLKKALAENRKVFGIWLQLFHPAIAEMVALVGYDVIAIDMEHGPGDLQEVANMMRGISGTGAAALVRIPSNEPVILKRLLDQGPDAVMVPLVETAEEARAAVAACRFPPRGNRGWAAGVARAARYGLDADYTPEAADNLFILCQIESVKGVRNVEEIAAVEGVDMIFIGRNDLAADAGHILDLDHPEMLAMLRHVAAAARRAGKKIGTVASQGLGWQELYDEGFDMVLPSGEISLLREACVAEVRSFRERFGDGTADVRPVRRTGY
jgi:4-hydroxy-2-oxoheptanedioate aldolase